MLEAELFALLERTADAAYTVTEGGEIRSWNAAAERLFGYRAAEVLARAADEVLDARDALGTPALARGRESPTRRADARRGIPNFDLEVRTRGGERIWVNVSTILFENARTGRPLLVRLARDITRRRRTEELLARAAALGRELASLSDEAADHAPVDALTPREVGVLTLFARGVSAPAVARELGISPQTLRNHLHRINRKLRTHSRLEAVAHARRRGLID